MTQLVSILIPAYNAERWLGDTIESALAQTWPNKEVIVVDDGSSDHTFKVARSFAARGVRVLSQSNAGASAARNAALRESQGAYIQFLDADDLLHPDKIRLQLQHADDGHRASVLLTSAWGRFFVRPDHATFSPGPLWDDLSPLDWLITKFSQNQFMLPASWLVSRRIARRAGPWNETLSLDDDGEYMCRLVAASRRVRFVGESKCYYRIGNASSLSSQKTERALRSQFWSLKLCIDHLLTLESSERTRHACVRLLQDNLQHFEPQWPELAGRCRELAHALGGELITPGERIHFRVYRSLFGWQAANALRSRVNRLRLQLRRTVDRLPQFHSHAN